MLLPLVAVDDEKMLTLVPNATNDLLAPNIAANIFLTANAVVVLDLLSAALIDFLNPSNKRVRASGDNAGKDTAKSPIAASTWR